MENLVYFGRKLAVGGAVAPVQRQVAAFIESRASKLNSRVLSMLAIKIGENPFAKVKKMIDSMITKLLEEANEESDKKGWCDKEIAAATKDRDYRLRDVADLHSQLESPLPDGGEFSGEFDVCRESH